MSASESYAKWRYRLVPDHLLGEVLSKSWIYNTIPFLFLIIVVVLFGSLIDGFLSLAGFGDLARQLGEVAFVTVGLALVMLAGGIDLSVGPTYALANFLGLTLVITSTGRSISRSPPSLPPAASSGSSMAC